MKTVKTPKGTDLPLLNLKGKDYLQVAHRLVWFNEVAERFTMSTELLICTDDQTVAKATITQFDKDGNPLKSVTATKRETKKDFSDHTEKAETGAIGRALALMGYGTQFALADLDEGSRLADSPVVDPRPAKKDTFVENFQHPSELPKMAQASAPAVPEAAPVKKSTFRKPAPKAEVQDEGGWT